MAVRIVWSLVVLLLTLQTRAEHGIIETLEAKHEGDIRFDAGAFIVTSTAGTNRIEPTLLTHLKFQSPAATNSASPTGEVRGLRGTYFTRGDLTGAHFVRIDPAVDFHWGLAAPFDGIGADYFSIRWEGEIEAPVTGAFTFFVQTDDGVNLYIDGKLIIGQWDRRPTGDLAGGFQFEAGKRYPIKMEYQDRDLQAFARLYWTGPSIPRSIVSSKHLVAAQINTTNVVSPTPTSGLLGLYYNEPDLTGPFKTRYDSTVDYDWGEAAPFTGINSDRFSVRWLGTLTPSLTEHYTFHTVTDDGVRLWIDNRLVIDSWREEFLNLSSIPMVLQAGKPYEFRLEMFDAGVRAVAKLFWSSSSMPRQSIPKAHFRPGTPPDPASQIGWRRIPPGITLVDGSILGCKIQSANDSGIKVADLRGITDFSRIKTARLTFNPITADALAALPRNRAGLLLANKDFIEGDFRGFKDGKIQLYSVLFGLKTFEARKVIAVILGDTKPTTSRFEVVTKDDSRLLVPDFSIHPDGVEIKGGILSGLKLRAQEVMEIKTHVAGPQAQALL